MAQTAGEKLADTPKPDEKLQGRLVLIDGFGIIFRAYHAIKSGLATSKGELTNATFGFTSMLLEVLRRDTPDYIVLAFEGGHTFRHEEFVEYKANRAEMPDDLANQIGRIREVVEALGITIYEQAGFEADDVIGTLARQANERGLEALIVTGDNDLLQLVNDQTRAVLPGAGPRARFSDARYYDVQGVIDRYGFGPEFVPDYKAIVGDKSDNIPNVPGLGEKTATDLITTYGKVENILEHLDDLKPKVAEALRSHLDQVHQSKRIATIVTEVPVQLDIATAKAGQANREKLIELFRELEFNTLVPKINNLKLGQSSSAGSPAESAPGTPSAPPAPAAKGKAENAAQVQPWKPGQRGQMSMFDLDRPADSPADSESIGPEALVTASAAKNSLVIPQMPAPVLPDNVKYLAVRTRPDLDRMIGRIKETGRFAFDTETTALDTIRAELVGVSISPAPGEAYYIPVAHRLPVTGNLASVTELAPDQLDWNEAREALEAVFYDQKIFKAAHHAKYDLEILHRAGLNLFKINVDFDVMIAAQLVGMLKAGLKDLAFNRLGEEMTHIEALIGTGKKQITIDLAPVENVVAYAGADADMTLRLVDDLAPQLERDGLAQLFVEVEMPLVPVLATMELCGITVDVPSLQSISTGLFKKMEQLEKEIYESVGYKFNINSPDQLGEALFGKLGLPGGKKTSTGKYSTTKEILEGLRDQDPAVGKILDFRHFGKLKSTYVDALPLLINPETGRIHTSFHQIGSATGRISSSDPNLQNIPIRTDAGSEIRRAFVADNFSDHRFWKNEESVLFAADYSQIELRILAHLTQDPRLVDAFQNDKDIHAATASDVFGVAENEVTPDMRRLAKTVNFGIIYGLSAFGLAQRTGFSVKEAGTFIKDYNERYPSIKAYLDQTPDQARETGYVQTILGRRRYMPELKNSNVVVRQAAERQAINMPVQGTAADIVKIAMVRVAKEVAEKNLRSKLLLQVHDELVFEAPRSELAVLAELVKRNMEGVVQLSVPLKADLKVGLNWRDMESYKIPR
ncbi:MAG: DNA polymerase I [Chloroflexi bacterium]|nr:DNA polymerase I [Chloroflexota bacterium]